MPPAGFLSSGCAACGCPKGSGCVSSVSKLSMRWRIVDFGWTLLRIRPSRIKNSTAVRERTNSSFSIVSILSQIVTYTSELAALKGDVVRAGGVEEAVGQLNAADLEFLEEARPQAGRHEVTKYLAVVVEAGLLEAEDILRRDSRALHLLDLSDVGDLAATVAQARLMDDQVDGRRDLLADGALGQLEAGHHDHRLESREDVARAVGMGRRQRAVVARVHGLQHVERLARADLANDDAVGAHTQGIAHEVADGDSALALEIGRARFERHDVLLLQAQLGSILDGDDALALGDERRDDVERRRLTGAGTARDEDVDARLDAGAQERRHLLVHRAEGNQVVDAKRRLGELADGQARADE